MQSLDLRRHCERRLGMLDRERQSWFAHWRELSNFILPRRGSFLGPVHRPDRGGKLNGGLLDATAMLAARTLASGLMAGISSPARPWFRLGIGSPQLSELPEVRLWLDDVAQRMFRVFARSNLYNALAVAYEELGVFGTAAVVVMEDAKEIVRAYPLTAGEYWLAASKRLSVNTLYRALPMTTFQLVERFGREAVSTQVRERYDRGEWDREVEVIHAVEPNESIGEEGSGAGRFGSHNMPFRSVWFERTGAADGVLAVGGFEEFPALCPRWHLIGNDVWGRSPGMDALPDAKGLQRMQLRFFQALEKMVNPPMVAPPSLRMDGPNGLPGGVTYVADPQGAGFRPAYQINPPLDQMSAAIDRRQQAVRAAFYADLFLMMTQLDDVRSATEIAERREEKMVMLGPVLERLHDDLLEPLIGRVFQIMARAGEIPPPPSPMLDGLRLQPEYVSPLEVGQPKRA
ncbi:portal protein [Reyranella sp.]|uniref:portal protein n=1 Tax=Reyranella sp. TaxID=1929291 RepID=UPI002730BBDA|nr:portal protein [Reyranella sp.]MDP2376422.1 portal protein [Reyranella sp.]